MLVPVFENLYVKQFVLYADEELDYYIQESDGKESTNTEKQIIRNDHAILAGRFGRINAMVQMTPANRNKAMMEYEEEDILANYIELDSLMQVIYHAKETEPGS